MNEIIEEDCRALLENSNGCNVDWKKLRGASLFITGGTGFFGKWFLDTFIYLNGELKLNAQCTVLSRSSELFLTSNPAYKRDDISFIEGDIRNFAIPERDFDYIIHAATPASAKLEQENPDEMRSIIVDGTRHVMEMAKRCHVKRVLLTSSGAVYGKQPSEISHISESFECNPTTVYGTGKFEAEKICLTSEIDTVIARCFAFVGPYLNLDIHYAIGNFIRDCIENRDIVIQGDGTPFRSYLYGSDLMLWLWTIILNAPTRSVYNVGSDREISIKDLAFLVSSRFKNISKVNVLSPIDTSLPISRYVPSCSLVQNDLGVIEHYSLEMAIDRSIQWNLILKENKK